LQSVAVWEDLEKSSQTLAEGIGAVARQAGIPIWQNRVGTMFTTFFTETPVRDWQTAKICDTKAFGKFFQNMLERGIYLAPSQFEAGFMSTAHGVAEIDITINAAMETFKSW